MSLSFNMHTVPLDELIKLLSVDHEGFADDSNIYKSFDLRDKVATLNAFTQVENCLADVESWMSDNMLKLNCSKTVVVLFKPKSQSQIAHQPTTLKVGTKHIKISNQYKTLGVVLDSHMKMEKQVGATTKSAYLHIRRISKVRRQLDRKISEALVNTLVTSRLDYCNSLICSLPKKTTKRLQCAQNAAARMILHGKRREHVTPLLKELHWLPISYRSQFKILVIAYKIMTNQAPQNISILLNQYRPILNLRSTDQRLLAPPGIPRNKCGERAFKNIAVTLWNNIPLSIRKADSLLSFKSMLKTYYFRLHYGSD